MICKIKWLKRTMDASEGSEIVFFHVNPLDDLLATPTEEIIVHKDCNDGG